MQAVTMLSPVMLRRLLGKAAFKLGDTQQAQSAYRAAIAANDSAPAAWMGLAEVADVAGSTELAVEAYERLVRRCPLSTRQPIQCRQHSITNSC